MQLIFDFVDFLTDYKTWKLHIKLILTQSADCDGIAAKNFQNFSSIQ